MKKKIDGKKKGGEFERRISKKLSLWISRGERDDLFWRTHGSGSRHTVRDNNGQLTEGQDGDICSTCSGVSEKFRDIFSLELKNYEDINLWGLITQKKTGLLDFWKQTKQQAGKVDKIPVLIIKENYRPILFISNQWTKYLFSIYLELDYILKSNLENETLYVWKLDDICKVNPNIFINALDIVLEDKENDD